VRAVLISVRAVVSFCTLRRNLLGSALSRHKDSEEGKVSRVSRLTGQFLLTTSRKATNVSLRETVGTRRSRYPSDVVQAN
jgi:hypothetical protein